jgi:hypothetical protein
MQTKRHYFAIACCIVLPLLYGCSTTNYGDNQFKLSMASSGKDVMWVPTKVEMADQMLTLAQVRSGDLVYDLACPVLMVRLLQRPRTRSTLSEQVCLLQR